MIDGGAAESGEVRCISLANMKVTSQIPIASSLTLNVITLFGCVAQCVQKFCLGLVGIRPRDIHVLSTLVCLKCYVVP